MNKHEWNSEEFIKQIPEEKRKYVINVLDFAADYIDKNYNEDGRLYVFVCMTRIIMEYTLIKSEAIDIIKELMSNESKFRTSNTDMLGVNAEAGFIQRYCEYKLKELKSIK